MNDLVVNLKLIETRMFFDTKWKIIVSKNGKEIANTTITRYDDENMRNLDKHIRSLSVISNESINSLDKRNSIYYD